MLRVCLYVHHVLDVRIYFAMSKPLKSVVCIPVDGDPLVVLKGMLKGLVRSSAS